MRCNIVWANFQKCWANLLVIALCQIALIPLKAICRTTSSNAKRNANDLSTSRSDEEGLTSLDVVLNQRWRRISDCRHPEWPSHLVLIDPSSYRASSDSSGVIDARKISLTMSLLVHAGDRVLLWKQDGVAHIETVGVSEESGYLGKHIQVRVSGVDMSVPESFRQVTGIVRGVSNVEIEQ
jgi:hypothetical protein